MSSPELDNLVGAGHLKAEPGTRVEFDGLLSSARKRLADARNETLALESRFDLAYNAAHGLALAALRQRGYRSESRYMVFQALQHTLGLAPRSGGFSPRLTTSGTSPSTKGDRRSTRSSCPTSSRVLHVSKPRSPS